MGNRMRAITRYWHTLRYVPFGRLISRTLFPLRRKLAVARVASGRKEYRPGRPLEPFWPRHEKARMLELATHRFTLLNESHAFGAKVDWRAPAMSALWQFNLNYFEFVHELAAEDATALCRDWIDSNPPGTEPAWHPYPTSLRIINWCKFGFEDETVARSLFDQLNFLYRFCETHLGGNHLLENARALVFGAAFFETSPMAEKWMSRALEIYRQQVPIQILTDGGHYERSPMYHAIVLEGFVDVCQLVGGSGPIAEVLVPMLDGMVQYLSAMTHPDGSLALFSDAANGIALPPAILLPYARQVATGPELQRAQFPATGYHTFSGSAFHVIIDAGPIGPDDLPAHGHADTFSFELSASGRQFVVDSGVFDYNASEMREYCRSTRCHNTVSVDDVSQAECWGAFRVARRFPPVDVYTDETGSGFQFSGSFDGFADLIGDDLLHKREVIIDDVAQVMQVRDRISGSGKHFFTSRIHLHPEVALSEKDDELQLQRGDCILRFRTESGYSIEDSWYCPEFGKRVANKVICLTAQLPTSEISYELSLSSKPAAHK